MSRNLIASKNFRKITLVLPLVLKESLILESFWCKTSVSEWLFSESRASSLLFEFLINYRWELTFP